MSRASRFWGKIPRGQISRQRIDGEARAAIVQGQPRVVSAPEGAGKAWASRRGEGDGLNHQHKRPTSPHRGSRPRAAKAALNF